MSPDNMTIKVVLTVKTGATREYDSYGEFIADWRFFFNSGAVAGNEEVFDKAFKALEALGEHGAAMEVLRYGMLVKLICSFHDYDAREGFQI